MAAECRKTKKWVVRRRCRRKNDLIATTIDPFGGFSIKGDYPHAFYAHLWPACARSDCWRAGGLGASRRFDHGRSASAAGLRAAANSRARLYLDAGLLGLRRRRLLLGTGNLGAAASGGVTLDPGLLGLE